MHKSRPFTLIELLLVIVVIAILAAMLLPALNRAKRTARILVCMSNMKELAKGMTLYAVEYDYTWPMHTKTTLNESYPNQIWNDRTSTYSNLGYVKSEWLDLFSELVLSNSNIGWCPFERWDKPTQLGGLYYSNSSTTIYNDEKGDLVVIGYGRLAGFSPIDHLTTDSGMGWTDTDNSQTDYAPYNVGRSDDVILVENTWNNISQSLDAHADNPAEKGHIWKPHITKYNENNVGYADGHVETHRHTGMTQTGGGNWYFADGHHAIRYHAPPFGDPHYIPY